MIFSYLQNYKAGKDTMLNYKVEIPRNWEKSIDLDEDYQNGV